MPSPSDNRSPQGSRTGVPALGGARPLAGLVREKLASDPGWATFTADQRRWVCAWCLSAVARRPQRSWEDSVAAHLEGCRHYGGGRFAPQPAASVAAQISFENMVGMAEADAAWGVFDAQGVWVCPACLERIPDVRLVANQRNQLTYRAMALHLQRCAAYRAGQINPPPVVRAVKERPAGPPQRPPATTTRQAAPATRPPGTGSPPAQPAIMTRPDGSAPPVATPLASPVQRHPVATPLASPVQVARSPAIVPLNQPGKGMGMVRSPLPVTGNHLRSRRFLSPLPGEPAPGEPPVQPAKPADAPPAEPEAPNFDWMDDADAAAGAMSAAKPPGEHVERTDLQRARDLQQNFLAEVPDIPGFRFATRYEPCDHVSGDFFSFVRLLDGRFGFAIADVSGHGMQAGLVMSMAKKTLEIYGELIGDPAEVLAKVNDALAVDLGGKMFVSISYAILSPSERTIRWARAGHNPTLQINAAGEVTEIRPPGMVVGMKAGQVFRDSLQTETTELHPGDTFLLYTDGVTEMTNAQGEEFQVERLREVLTRCAAAGPDDLLTQVMDRVRHFRGTKPAADDVTLLALTVD